MNWVSSLLWNQTITQTGLQSQQGFVQNHKGQLQLVTCSQSKCFASKMLQKPQNKNYYTLSSEACRVFSDWSKPLSSSSNSLALLLVGMAGPSCRAGRGQSGSGWEGWDAAGPCVRIWATPHKHAYTEKGRRALCWLGSIPILMLMLCKHAALLWWLWASDHVATIQDTWICWCFNKCLHSKCIFTE